MRKLSCDQIFRSLSDCIRHRDDLAYAQTILEKLKNCYKAEDQDINLADFFNNPDNVASLNQSIGPENYINFVELARQVILSNYTQQSTILEKGIQDEKQVEFAINILAEWQKFNIVLFFRDSHQSETHIHITPQRNNHKQLLQDIPPDTLLVIALKTKKGERDYKSRKLEIEAINQATTMFDSLQFVESTDPDGIANELQIAKPKKTATKPSKRRSTYSHKFTLQSQNIPKDPIFSFRLCVNKSDIFIHAGNANLIIQQIRKYDGHVKMYVDRGEKVKVDLNADAIWGAEIRSGEYVIYEFYGEHPPEDSLASDLAKVTNKYTQMDKIV